MREGVEWNRWVKLEFVDFVNRHYQFPRLSDSNCTTARRFVTPLLCSLDLSLALCTDTIRSICIVICIVPPFVFFVIFCCNPLLVLLRMRYDCLQCLCFNCNIPIMRRVHCHCPCSNDGWCGCVCCMQCVVGHCPSKCSVIVWGQDMADVGLLWLSVLFYSYFLSHHFWLACNHSEIYSPFLRAWQEETNIAKWSSVFNRPSFYHYHWTHEYIHEM